MFLNENSKYYVHEIKCSNTLSGYSLLYSYVEYSYVNIRAMHAIVLHVYTKMKSLK